jgi:hypothetical protein
MELPEVRKNQFDSETVDIYPLIWKHYQVHVPIFVILAKLT